MNSASKAKPTACQVSDGKREEREDSDASSPCRVPCADDSSCAVQLLSLFVSVRFGKASASNRTKAVLLCLESSHENVP